MPTETSEESAVGSLPAAFCENFEQRGIGAIIASRGRRTAVGLLILLAGMYAA
jgi:hypothetical protein